MEGLMASVVALDTSPINILRGLRGEIVAARIAYPNVLHIEVRDSHDGVWRLATQDAGWRPADPGSLVGESVEGAEIDVATGELGCRLSGGSTFKVIPGTPGSGDDPPNWELLTPEGLVLEFGPGVRWQIAGAGSRASARQ
jgi:hypothetical protein